MFQVEDIKSLVTLIKDRQNLEKFLNNRKKKDENIQSPDFVRQRDAFDLWSPDFFRKNFLEAKNQQSHLLQKKNKNAVKQRQEKRNVFDLWSPELYRKQEMDDFERGKKEHDSFDLLADYCCVMTCKAADIAKFVECQWPTYNKLLKPIIKIDEIGLI